MALTITRVAIAIALCATLACEASNDSPMVTLVDEGSYEDVWQRYLSTTRPAMNGGVIAEGDHYFASEDKLRAYFDERMLEDVDKAHASQRASTGYVPKYPFPASRNIRYCVSNDFAPNKATWVARVADAARAWEKVASIRFVYLSAFDSACTAAQAGVDFAVIRTDGSSGYFACSKLRWPELDVCPTSQSFGVLEIDTMMDVTFGGDVPNMTATGVLRHELGHMLGLRHEHPWRAMIDGSCGETPDIAAQDLTGLQLTDVAYDRFSVMHYPFLFFANGVIKFCNGDAQSTYALTKTDGFSIQQLYGMHPGWVDAAVNAVGLL